MAIMYSFCFYFSVRLGSLIVGIYFLIKNSILAILCSVWVNSPVENTRKILKPYMEDQNLLYLSRQAKIIYKDPSLHSQIFLCYSLLRICSSLGQIYGTYYCKKYWLLPSILLEFFDLIGITLLFVSLMILIKENSQDLGLLIGATLSGSFTLLFFFYCWACILALFQVLKDFGIEGAPEEEKNEEPDKLYERRPRQDFIQDVRRYPRYPNYPPIYPQTYRYGQLIAPIY